MARRPIPSCPDNGKHHSRFSIPLSFCLYFLTFTTILEIFRARHHLSIAVYILTFYICLMLMIVCIHVFNRSPENSETKRRLFLVCLRSQNKWKGGARRWIFAEGHGSLRSACTACGWVFRLVIQFVGSPNY
ncbi:hypothetical protein AAC387_Pa01g0289 [Persea americana]